MSMSSIPSQPGMFPSPIGTRPSEGPSSPLADSPPPPPPSMLTPPSLSNIDRMLEEGAELPLDDSGISPAFPGMVEEVGGSAPTERAGPLTEVEEKARKEKLAKLYEEESDFRPGAGKATEISEERVTHINKGLDGLKEMAEGFSTVNNKPSYWAKHIQYLKGNWKQNLGKLAFGLACIAAITTVSILTLGTVPAFMVGGGLAIKLGLALIGTMVAGSYALGKNWSVKSEKTSKSEVPQLAGTSLQNASEQIAKIKNGEDLYSAKMNLTKLLRDECQHTTDRISALNGELNLANARFPKDEKLIKNLSKEIGYQEQRLVRARDIGRYTHYIVYRHNAQLADSQLDTRKNMLEFSLILLADLYQKDVAIAKSLDPDNQSFEGIEENLTKFLTKEDEEILDMEKNIRQQLGNEQNPQPLQSFEKAVKKFEPKELEELL